MKLHQSSILFLTLLFSIGHSAAHADDAFNQGRATDAELMALFHPFDASLSTIAAMVASATDTIDIALYNIDIGSTNPIIAALESDAVKSRLQSGSLKIRLIYEGYAEPEVNAKLMTQREPGIDVRALASGKSCTISLVSLMLIQTMRRLFRDQQTGVWRQ